MWHGLPRPCSCHCHQITLVIGPIDYETTPPNGVVGERRKWERKKRRAKDSLLTNGTWKHFRLLPRVKGATSMKALKVLGFGLARPGIVSEVIWSV